MVFCPCVQLELQTWDDLPVALHLTSGSKSAGVAKISSQCFTSLGWNPSRRLVERRG